MKATARFLEQLSARLNNVAMIGAVLAIAVMLGAATWQVLARYFLAQPPAWTEELARFSMVWAGLLGASCAFRQKQDPTLFPNAISIPGRAGKILALTRVIAVILFIFPILWFSTFGLGISLSKGYVARLIGRQAETMDIPMAIFGISIPIAFTLIFIHLTADLSKFLAEGGSDETNN